MCVCVCVCVCVCCNILMKQWWLIVQLKTALTCDMTGLTCFCFKVKNLKRTNTCCVPIKY